MKITKNILCQVHLRALRDVGRRANEFEWDVLEQMKSAPFDALYWAVDQGRPLEPIWLERKSHYEYWLATDLSMDEFYSYMWELTANYLSSQWNVNWDIGEVEIKLDVQGDWIHVMNDDVNLDNLLDIRQVNGEICVSILGEQNLFHTRNTLFAAVFHGCCEVMFDRDVYSWVDSNGRRRIGDQLGSHRTEGGLIPSNNQLRGFIIEDEEIRQVFANEFPQVKFFASVEEAITTR